MPLLNLALGKWLFQPVHKVDPVLLFHALKVKRSRSEKRILVELVRPATEHGQTLFMTLPSARTLDGGVGGGGSIRFALQIWISNYLSTLFLPYPKMLAATKHLA